MWNRSFGNLGNRFAGLSVKYEQLATLGGHDNGLASLAIHCEVNQRGLGGHVVVPNVVMGSLKVPAGQSGFRIDGDDGAGILIHHFCSMATEVIGCRVPRRHVDQPQLVVGGCQAPYIGRSASVGLALGRQRRIALASHIPSPRKFSRARVIRPDDAGWFISLLVIRNPAANDEHAAGKGGRRRDEVEIGFHLAHARQQRDLAFVAEIRAGLSGGFVHGDHAGIGRCRNNALCTDFIGAGVG